MLRPRRIPALLAAAALLVGLRAGADPTGADPAGAPRTCPVCDLWDRHEADLRQALVEVGALDEGVVYLFHSSNFRVIEALQRFAYERQAIEEDGPVPEHAAGRHPDGPAPHTGPLSVQIATSSHGFFALLTTTDPARGRALREQASRAMRHHGLVRF